ncbi:MAG: DUF5799 family protein [Salinirussus sp.]
MADWTDKLARARITVDKEFYEDIERSQFTEQEWGLIMTAVEWRVHNASDPQTARLVADTSKVKDILPQLREIRTRVEEAQRGVQRPRTLADGFTGWINGFVEMLGNVLSDEARDARLDDAEQLANKYALRVQEHLEDKGRWEEVRLAAAEEQREAEAPA